MSAEAPVPAVRAIHQILPYLGYGDAVGNYALALRDAFRSWGLRSDIFAPAADRQVNEARRSTADFLAVDSVKSLVILHYAIYSQELRLFQTCLGRRLLVFHNVTPAQYFLPWSLHHYYLTDLGRSYVRDAVHATDFLLTPSQFNRRDLVPVGGSACRVMPLVTDVARLATIAPRADLLARLRDGSVNLLFVGRIAPNKRHDDLIRAFAAYHDRWERRSRLVIVGGWYGLERYQEALVAQAREAGVADRVLFLGHVQADDLVACYRAADVFLCLSEHEGFCVPLLEAMQLDVPIVARAAAAVPETLGGAGVLVEDRDFAAIAAAVDRLVGDAAHRRDVLRRQAERLRELAPDRVLTDLRAWLTDVVAA